MENLIRVIQTAFPVFVLLGIGMLLRKNHLTSREGIDSIKNIAVNITLPAVLFSAFATAQYNRNSIVVPLYMFVICVVALVLGFGACRVFKIGGKRSPYLATGFEAGMLGYTLFSLLYPNDSTSAFAIVDLGQVLFVFTLYKALLSDKGDRKKTLQEAVRSPIIWAIVAGLLLGASGLMRILQPSGISGLLLNTADFLSAPTGALILLAIGYDLDLRQVRWSETMKLVCLRLGVMGLLLLLSLAVNRFILGGMIHTGALILMFLLPPPYVLPVFSDVEQERSSISSALSVLTAISLVLFAIMSGLMM